MGSASELTLGYRDWKVCEANCKGTRPGIMDDDGKEW